MKAEANIFDRLRKGVKIETLSERDASIINELFETGNEQIILSSETMETAAIIEAAIPFDFVVVHGAGKSSILIEPENSPARLDPQHVPPIIFTDDVILKWI